MHIDVVPNRGSRPAYLLREAFRDGARVRKRTLANLSALSDEQIFAIRAILRGESLSPAGELFEAIASRPHGHVQAVRLAMQRLGVTRLLGTRASRERELVGALVAARVLAPHTKLATTRWWHTTTLAEECKLDGADADDLYAAMDWLLKRQGAIEKKLAARHLKAGGLVLYDLTSSYFEGSGCPLAKMGYNRDGKKGKLQVNYGLVSDARGCPIAVSVFDGNTADCETLTAQVARLKDEWGIERFVVVGDRGMISQKGIDELKTHPGVDWITALKSAQIRCLKTIDLKVRPIHHRLAERVRAHLFLCLLAYYVKWHMREAWRAMLFADEDPTAKVQRDPVAPAKRSAQAEHKAHTHTLSDGTPAHSFRTLLEELATIVRNTCRTVKAPAQAPTFTIVTQPNPIQQRALQLLDTIPV